VEGVIPKFASIRMIKFLVYRVVETMRKIGNPFAKNAITSPIIDKLNFI